MMRRVARIVRIAHAAHADCIGRAGRVAVARSVAGLPIVVLVLLAAPVAAEDRRALAAGPGVDAGAILPGVREHVVFEAARIDRHPMRTSALRSSEAAVLAVDRIEHHWRTTPDAPIVRTRAGAWLIVSRLTGQGIETVQLRDANGGSEGFRTRWGRRLAASPRPDWLPAAAGPVQRIESSDGPRGGATTIAALPGGVSVARQAVLEALGARGWKADDTGRLQPAAQAAGRAGRTLTLMRRGNEEMLISIGPTPAGAVLIAHQTESP